MNPNRKAFLDTIAFSEGVRTGQHPLTQRDGYDVIVTGVDGPELFTDFAAHPFAHGRPPKIVNRAGLKSTAAGRYQFLVGDWDHYRHALSLPDFSPASQDLWAIQLIRERGALPLIDGGQFALAVARCCNLWASLPGAGYGQHENRMAALAQAYERAGGEVA